MGIFYHAIQVPKALTLSFFLNASYFIIGALTRFGIFKPPPPEQESPTSRDDRLNSYTLIVDSSCPSLVHVPVHVVTAAIKSRLLILRRQDLRKYLEEEEEDDESLSVSEDATKTSITCTVCLDSIDVSDDVRELRNCEHMFHRKCLDRWVDEGKITCPLCRSMLLPPRTILECYYRSSREGNTSIVS